MTYGESEYSEQSYGLSSSSTNGVNLIDLMAYLPNFIQNSGIMYSLQQEVKAPALTQLKVDIEDLKAQCFVQTATWGLNFWEAFLDIKTDVNKSIENRRSVVLAKLQGYGTVTVKKIQEVCQSFNDGTVSVEEDNEHFTFKIKFVDIKGIPPNIQDIKDAVEEIKPAHLLAEYIYIYTLWGELLGHTWGELTNYTWEQITLRRWQ